MATNIKETVPTDFSQTVAQLIEAVMIERTAATHADYIRQMQGLSNGYGNLIMKVQAFGKKLETRNSTVHDDVHSKYQEFFKETLELTPVEAPSNNL
jgi:hypothetical protein